MSDPLNFVGTYVAEKSVKLRGVNWQMVIGTLEESADNCFRCKNKGCDVCRMTRDIALNIKRQTEDQTNDQE